MSHKPKRHTEIARRRHEAHQRRTMPTLSFNPLLIDLTGGGGGGATFLPHQTANVIAGFPTIPKPKGQTTFEKVSETASTIGGAVSAAQTAYQTYKAIRNNRGRVLRLLERFRQRFPNRRVQDPDAGLDEDLRGMDDILGEDSRIGRMFGETPSETGDLAGGITDDDVATIAGEMDRVADFETPRADIGDEPERAPAPEEEGAEGEEGEEEPAPEPEPVEGPGPPGGETELGEVAGGEVPAEEVAPVAEGAGETAGEVADFGTLFAGQRGVSTLAPRVVSTPFGEGVLSRPVALRRLPRPEIPEGEPLEAFPEPLQAPEGLSGFEGAVPSITGETDLADLGGIASRQAGREALSIFQQASREGRTFGRTFGEAQDMARLIRAPGESAEDAERLVGLRDPEGIGFRIARGARTLGTRVQSLAARAENSGRSIARQISRHIGNDRSIFDDPITEDPATSDTLTMLGRPAGADIGADAFTQATSGTAVGDALEAQTAELAGQAGTGAEAVATGAVTGEAGAGEAVGAGAGALAGAEGAGVISGATEATAGALAGGAVAGETAGAVAGGISAGAEAGEIIGDIGIGLLALL